VKLIDTRGAIDHLRGQSAAVELLQGLIESEEPVFASEVMRFELLAGVREDEVGAVEEFCSAPSWAPVGEEVAHSLRLIC
jgi:hypothetical protein